MNARSNSLQSMRGKVLFKKHFQRAQVLPIFAVSLIALLALAALSIDVSSWYYQQRLAQSAADAGAISGAIQLEYLPSTATIPSLLVKNAAQKDATTNYFTTGSGIAVAVHQPPTSGPYSTNTSAVEVVVTKSVTTFFAKVFGLTSTVKARAVAYENMIQLGCIYALSGDIVIHGQPIKAPNCGVIANGKLDMTGNGCTSSVAGSFTSVAKFKCAGGNTTPGIQQGIAAADPCALIMNCNNLKTFVAANVLPCYGNSSQCTVPFAVPSCSGLMPGRYISTINCTGQDVNFAAGTYVLNGFNVHGANGHNGVLGSNVTIYNNSGTIDFGGDNVSLTAPTSGSTAGILFFSPNAATDLTYSGSGSGLSGMLYFPKSNITLNGSPGTYAPLIVGANVTTDGSSMNIPFSTTLFNPFVGRIVLGE